MRSPEKAYPVARTGADQRRHLARSPHEAQCLRLRSSLRLDTLAVDGRTLVLGAAWITARQIGLSLMSGNHFSIAAERMAAAREGIAREQAMMDEAGLNVYLNAAGVSSAIEDDLLQLTQEALGLGLGQTSRQKQAAATLGCPTASLSTVEQLELERRRIARELHDRLGQRLTLLKLGLDELGRALPGDDAKIRERLAALKGLADDAGSEAHRIAWEIRPALLDDLGLEAAIRQLAETWSERSAMRFDLSFALGERQLSPTIEITLYRVLQEAITNVVRHAGATRVVVLLAVCEKEVSMIVEDNGRGFSPDRLRGACSKHLGLLGIRERLYLISGTLEIESAPGKGCTLYIRAPL